jgi:hypothetical protein
VLVRRITPPGRPAVLAGPTVRANVRFEWGWGQPTEFTEWEGRLELSDGRLVKLIPCFRHQDLEAVKRTGGTRYGASRLEGEPGQTPISRVTEHGETGCSWQSFSLGNETQWPRSSALVLQVEMPPAATIRARVNGRRFEHRLAELLEGQRSHLVGPFLGPAVSFHRAVPASACELAVEHLDTTPERPTDHYYARVRQRNNQWAWSSPVWVTGG